MKIIAIEFIDHPLLKGEKFVFKNSLGVVADIYLIAGENGLGKTSLLESLAGVNSRLSISQRHDAVIDYECTEQEFIELLQDRLTEVELAKFTRTGFSVEVLEWYENYNLIKQYRFTISKENGERVEFYDLDSKFEKLRKLKYLPAFMDKDSITEYLSILNVNYNEEKSTTNNFLNKNFPFLSRSIYMEGEKNDQHELTVENSQTSFQNLSTGEKKIFLLKLFLNNLTEDNGIIMLDEPELGLHPKWQQKLIELFKEQSSRNVQIIMTTHSPFLLQSGQLDSASISILKRDKFDNRLISTKSVSQQPAKSLLREIFDTDVFLLTNKILFVEGETDELYIKRCIEAFEHLDFTYEVKWVGRKDKKDKAVFSGISSLNSLKSFLEANEKYISVPVALLYDCDANKQTQSSKKIITAALPTIESNRRFKRGIENILNLPSNLELDQFYSQYEKIDEYGAVSMIGSLNKIKMCSYICNLSDRELREVFRNLHEFLITLP